jgi:hypothetical protein
MTALLPIMGVVLVAFLVIGLALPVLPLHVHQGLGLSTFVVGLVTGSQFAASITRVWSGHCAEGKAANNIGYALRSPDSFSESKTRSRMRSGSRSPVPVTSIIFRATISVTGSVRSSNWRDAQTPSKAADMTSIVWGSKVAPFKKGVSGIEHSNSRMAKT